MVITGESPLSCENCVRMTREAQERCDADKRLSTTLTIVCAECDRRYEHELSPEVFIIDAGLTTSDDAAREVKRRLADG